MTLYNEDDFEDLPGDLRLWPEQDLKAAKGLWGVKTPGIDKELRRRNKVNELHQRFWGKTVLLRGEDTHYVVQHISPDTLHLTVRELGGTITRTVTYGNAEVQW